MLVCNMLAYRHTSAYARVVAYPASSLPVAYVSIRQHTSCMLTCRVGASCPQLPLFELCNIFMRIYSCAQAVSRPVRLHSFMHTPYECIHTSNLRADLGPHAYQLQACKHVYIHTHILARAHTHSLTHTHTHKSIGGLLLCYVH
jgi:hypothetical protein